MNYWLVPIAFLLGGMTLKWVLDLFFLRHVYREHERKLNLREADFTALKHDHSKALTDLKIKLTELDATSKAKALADGNLAKSNLDLGSLRTHLLRTEEELKASRHRELDLTERSAKLSAELQLAATRMDSLELESRERTSAGESLRLQLAESTANFSTQVTVIAELRASRDDAQRTTAEQIRRITELEGALDAEHSVLATLESAVRSRDAQIADCQSRFVTLEAERQSVAASLKVADRELGIAQAALNERTKQLAEATELSATREVEVKSFQSKIDELMKARVGAESLIKKREAEVSQWERQADDHKQLAEATAAENRRLLAETAELRRSSEGLNAKLVFAQAETTRLAAELLQQAVRAKSLEAERAELRSQLDSKPTLPAEIPTDSSSGSAARIPSTPTEPDLILIDRLRDTEAELEAVSRSHAQLETELANERARSAELENKLQQVSSTIQERPIEVARGASSEAKLLDEIDELNRERNALAAELAALKAAHPSTHGATRKRSNPPKRAAEVELFPTPTPPPTANNLANDVAAPSIPSRESSSGLPPGDPITEFATRCPQHLSDVKGIGPDFEQRLYAAGVGSYWELTQLTDRTFAEVLELDSNQCEQFDFSGTRADARHWAEATQTVGRKWTGDQPDDLEPLEGIGPAIEKRLYDAGICTFAALAAASEETLAEICPVAKFRGAHYARWIEQAKQRLAEEEN